MFILSCISSGLGFQSVNQTSIYENSELKMFKIITFFVDISNKWPEDLLGTNVYKMLDTCW